MTVSEYISQTFTDFGVHLSEAAIISIALRDSLDTSEELSSGNFEGVDRAVVKAIPLLLLTPGSVSEGSLSISKTQKESILDYYRSRCKQLGIEDTLTKKPRITFL